MVLYTAVFCNSKFCVFVGKGWLRCHSFYRTRVLCSGVIPRCDHSHSPRPVVMLVAMLVACVYKIAHCSMLRAAAGSNGMSHGLLPVVVGCGVSKTSSGPEGVDVGFFLAIFAGC